VPALALGLALPALRVLNVSDNALGDMPAPDAHAAAGGLPLAPIAVLEDPASGRRMTVATDAPGVQLYTGNFLGAGPAPHDQHRALCLETQNYPDAVNQADGRGWPSAILRPGATYSHTTVHTFEW
jgi:galactose mutarotase-like enzyme